MIMSWIARQREAQLASVLPVWRDSYFLSRLYS